MSKELDEEFEDYYGYSPDGEYDEDEIEEMIWEEEMKSSRQKPGNSKSTSGCYVATCVYGSYDCPQVWVLRRYRDTVLSKTWYGRAFINTYYAISPTVVRMFGEKSWFKSIWIVPLNKIVYKLMNKGFSSEPYND